jgi:hypothetical protein
MCVRYVQVNLSCPSQHYCASKVTCEPCRSKANRWQSNGDMPLGIDFIKNERNSLNRKQVIHFFYVAIMFLIYNL